MEEITIGSESPAREKITLNLVGKKYTIHAPKTWAALDLGKRGMHDEKRLRKDPSKAIEGIETWIAGVFAPKDLASVRARLADPADDLDFEHIAELMQKVSEAMGKAPTT